MKNTIAVLFLSAFAFIAVDAQPTKITVTSGVWTFTEYAANIIKISFTPKGYTTNENISNAVNSKALAGHKIPVTANDESATVAGKLIRIFQKGAYRGFTVALNEGEKIFGGGERALPLNRRGYQFNLYNNPWYGYSNGADNLNFSVPFFTSSSGYGLFFDNVSKGYADIGKANPNIFEAGFVSGELNVFLIFGKDYKDILSSYYKLTGTQPLPPRWAMGNFMSRFGYTSEAQTREIAGKMKKENIPFDAIIFDLFWFGDSIKGTMGNLDWVNKTKWPNPKKMIGDFKKDNINSILIAEPFILKGSKNYNAAKKYLAVDSMGKPFTLTDFYFGNGGLLDIFRKDAGTWIWQNHYKKQIANGVNAWWTDLGEPEKHPAEIRHNLKSSGISRLMGADEIHNAYGHYWNKMLSDNYTKEFPNRRLFHLNRSGFAGSQRYSIFPWSGDISRSWNGLQAQLPLMLGMSMSGVPYIHADAGGFAGGEADNELYVRWLQYAAFTPIFRPHGTALFEVDRNTFSFPSEPALIDTPYRDYARQSVWLRYLMLPYNYTLAYKQASKGEPLVAPLYYYYPTDTTAVNVNDEFMWGENMLVAPVLEKNAAERKLYLPEGRWFDFFDTTSFAGGVWLNKAVDMHSIPAFVKEGSFIPLMSIQPSKGTVGTVKDLNSRIDLKILYYPSSKATSGMFYDDDGESKNATGEIINFTGITIGNKMLIEISTSNKNLYQKGLKRKIAVGSFKQLDYPRMGKYNGRALLETASVKIFYPFHQQNPFELINIEFSGEPVKLELNLSPNK